MSFVPRKRRAMTLVELLVAALVLVTLAILLLVFAARAREEQSITLCRSSLRQIHLAICMYQGNFRNYMPAWHGKRPDLHGWTMTDLDNHGRPVWQGIGLLYQQGFVVKDNAPDRLTCPGVALPRFRRSAGPYGNLFACDKQEPFWTLHWKDPSPQFSNDNGQMDLGAGWPIEHGRQSVVSNYWLRVYDDPAGTAKAGSFRPDTVLASDTILGPEPLPGLPLAGAKPVVISNHDRKWNVLFYDGHIKTYDDVNDHLIHRLSDLQQTGRQDYVGAAGRSRLIFEEFFDPLYED